MAGFTTTDKFRTQGPVLCVSRESKNFFKNILISSFFCDSCVTVRMLSCSHNKKTKEKNKMKNTIMNIFKLFSLKNCSNSSVLSHYDLGMYLWY